MKTRKIALFAILVALSVGTNYALVGVWNVKFMDFIVFVGGFCLGPISGGLMGVLSWAVYGSINPLGFNLYVWFATMATESIYGIAGGIIKRMFKQNTLVGSSDSKINIVIFFGVVGVLLTMVYDVVNNVVWSQVSGINLILVLIMGVPFTIAHLASNAVFFSVGTVPVIRAITKMMRGGEKIVDAKK
jgi:hypothetical protein